MPDGEDPYEWNTANWGTKWDICDPDLTFVDVNSLDVNFNTAWAPPEKFYETMGSLGFVVTGLYNEFGMCYCGIFTNDPGSDYGNRYVQYHRMTNDERQVHIPEILLDTFQIDELLTEWNEED